MENDIFIKAIKETVEEYVKDDVRVSVYKKEPKEYWSKYTIQLDNSFYHTKYELDNRYCNKRTYIMRVVSDLCINLAKMTQRERNDFFKISNDEVKDIKNYINNIEQQCKKQKEVIDKSIDFIKNGDLLYLANKNSIVYRNNIEVRAVADRLNDLLQILEELEKGSNNENEIF